MNSFRLIVFLLITLVTIGASPPVTAEDKSQDGAAPQSNSHPPDYFEVPDFDIRGNLPNALPPAKPNEPSRANDAQAATLRLLEQEAPGLRVRWSALTGAPSRLYRQRGFLTGPSNAPATEIAESFLARNLQLLGLSASDLSEQRYTRNAKSQNNGVTHLIIQQQVDGIDVFGGQVQINITKEGRVLNVSGEPMPNVHASVNSYSAALTAEDAINTAASHAQISVIKSSRSEGLVFFPAAKGNSRLAWKVVVNDADSPNSYRVLVDAMDGTVLWRRNGTKYAHIPTHGEVYDTDSPVPNNPIGPSPVEVPQVDHPFHGAGQEFPPILGSPNFTHDDDHYDWWNGSGEADRSRTVSNNVIAQDDRGGTNSSGSPVVVGGDDFTSTPDLTMEPDTYTPAAVVNLFYWSNFYHDITYRFGFTEAFSNYQVDNFGNGGVGGDPFIGDAQDRADPPAPSDPTSSCNANFDTNALEGSPGRVQMFVCDSAIPRLDGDFSSGTIIHELHHGLASRITSGLHGGVQGGGLGEGGGDFQDIAFLVKPGDDLNGGYGHSQYYTSNPNGNRGEPYTIRPGYPNTYGDMGDSVHANGEIWANALWIARASMAARYGFVGASNTIIQLQIDGYKLSANDPDFLDMRDAILLADQVDYDGAHECLLWQAFARQGMGASATSTGNNDENPVEAFDTPLECIPVISVNPTNMDFGLIPLDPVNDEIGTGSLNLDVCNTGNNADLFLTNVVIEGEDPDSDFSVVSPNPNGFPVQISHDFCFPVEVQCNPSVSGLNSANLQIESSDPINPVLTSVNLSCTGAVPAIQVPGDIAFGDVCLGSTATETLNVCNTGNSHLEINDITVSDPQFSVATPTGGYPVYISPDFCFPFDVTFTPDGFGGDAAVVQIFSNDSTSPTAVDLTGNTPPPDINLAIANNGDFGNVCKGDYVDLNLTLFNQGKCDLTIDPIELVPPGGSFILPSDINFPLVLSPDADFNYPIRYAPTECDDIPENAQVKVTSDDPDESMVSVSISGTSPCPNLVIDPSALSGLYAFPTTVVDIGAALGCYSERDATLRNTGLCPMTISDISATGLDFTVMAPTQFPVVLPTGEETLNVTLRFTPQDDLDPQVPNEVIGLLTVASDDPDFPHTADLCGESAQQSGVRILVSDISSGVPIAVDEVDSMTIQSKGKNRPGPVNLQFTDQPLQDTVVCGNTIAYHVNQESLPATYTAGNNPKSSYQAKAMEGNLQTTESFPLGQCEFRDFQLQLQDSDSPVCLLKPKGESCTTAGDCCSFKCKGPEGGKTCK